VHFINAPSITMDVAAASADGSPFVGVDQPLITLGPVNVILVPKGKVT
jgi:hypothetical protein